MRKNYTFFQKRWGRVGDQVTETTMTSQHRGTVTTVNAFSGASKFSQKHASVKQATSWHLPHRPQAGEGMNTSTALTGDKKASEGDEQGAHAAVPP
jgi:hypothetical protein